MHRFPDQSQVKNLLLRALSPADFDLLAPHLTAVDLPIRTSLVEPFVPITTSWFIETAIASMVTTSPEGHESESGFAGRCGLVDMSAVLGTDSSPIQCYIQVPGHGFSMPLRTLRKALDASASLRAMLLRYVQVAFTQVAHTALSNAAHGVEERLARWLLMCFDRIDGDDLPLTHEFAALMLNVRRPAVTIALGSLTSAGLISTRRGSITLQNLGGLRDLASDSYGAPEAEYERLMGIRLMRSA